MRGLLYLIGGFVLLLSGCQATANVYVPTPHSTPLLEKKGDVHLAAYSSGQAADFHAAYALSNRIGLGASASFFSEDFDDSQDFQNHRYGGVSLIYSIPIEESYIRAEVLGSFGIGEGKAFDNYKSINTSEQVFAKGRYFKTSLQPNIAIGYDAFAFGISPKLSYISFYDFVTTAEDQGNGNSSFFFEPAIFTRIGFFKYLILEVQVGSTSALREVEFSYDGKESYDTPYLGVGVTVDLNILGNTRDN